MVENFSQRSDDEQRITTAVDLARELVADAAADETNLPMLERRRQARLAILVRNPAAADFTVRLSDEVPRIPDPSAAARRFAGLTSAADLRGFSVSDRLMLRVGSWLAPRLPQVVMPLVVRRLRGEASAVILPGEDPGFTRHIARRRREGLRPNVNVLGEAIVGHDEARHRLDQVIDRLRRPDVDYVSVKLSAICADLSALAFDTTVARASGALRELYTEAAHRAPHAFVNLDMEEYRDLDLTVATFRSVLDEEPFRHLDAGIVLQAYLPDTRRVAHELGTWATKRRAGGGGRIKIRLVKGANLAMERVDGELHGWTTAPYDDKLDVDANYKAVLDVLLDPAFDDSVRVGLASHNLFDVAWALGLADEMRAAERPARIEIEMLEGMAPAQADAVRRLAGDVLLYTPVVDRRDFPSAIAYLVRRLDENTSPENFLAHIFDLADDPKLFDEQADRFAASAHARHTVTDVRRRHTSRLDPPTCERSLPAPFANAADTDWTHPDNRAWIVNALAAKPASASRPATPTVDDIDAAVHRAASAGARWAALPLHDRAARIDRVAHEFETNRDRLIATMAADTAKTIAEADPEVSEAIDFARYYARAALALGDVAGATPNPIGVVVVTPPWNFPFAIPAGGALAALAAGNPVILKPAPQSRDTAHLLADLCWRAGLDQDLLQYLPTEDDDAGRRLVTHPDVSAVILTGAHSTARMFLDWRPDLRLHAETSGKNAMVVTACADVDRAVVDLVRSAFGNAGQKCSAASLAIVEAPLHDDPRFLERLRDAAATLQVGHAHDLATDIGPLVGPPDGDLRRGLTRLESEERWLLRPELRSDDGCLWSPGIRIGVRPESWFARTECFGPVLGIVRADDLDHAIHIQNSGHFGLTAGLHSLDPDEISRWTAQVHAGNLYVNRGTTGAIVRRQPFGGWKRSVVGPTAKAGGPNYVTTLARWTDTGTDLSAIGNSFLAWMRDTGRREHDPTGLAAESNIFRYRPLEGGVLVRCGTDVTARARDLLTTAASATDTRVLWSDATEETAVALAARLTSLGVDRLRIVGTDADTPDHDLRRAAHANGTPVDTSDPVGAAGIELPRWLREQSVTITRHRHGRLTDGARSLPSSA